MLLAAAIAVGGKDNSRAHDSLLLNDRTSDSSSSDNMIF